MVKNYILLKIVAKTLRPTKREEGSLGRKEG